MEVPLFEGLVVELLISVVFVGHAAPKEANVAERAVNKVRDFESIRKE